MEGFSEHLRSILEDEPEATTRKAARRRAVYMEGGRDDNIYYVITGQLKLTMLSTGGRECLLDIYTAGDFFGESCLSSLLRIETVTAMSDALVRHLPSAAFLALLAKKNLVQDFARHLVARLADRQQLITRLATVDCESRLGDVLLRLSHKLGAPEGGGAVQRLSHQELSQMVGTTRPRISELLQRFRVLGLIDTTPGAQILVRERHLQQYLQARRMECRAAAS